MKMNNHNVNMVKITEVFELQLQLEECPITNNT